MAAQSSSRSQHSTFEWLTDFEGLSQILNPSILQSGAACSRNSEVPTCDLEKKMDVLYIGCGSSKIGEKLLEEFPESYGSVVNVDRDCDALLFMEERWRRLKQELSRKEDDTRLAYESDASATAGVHDRMEMQQQQRWVRADFEKESSFREKIPSEAYELVLDKSTLDFALCCPDAASALLCESYRALAPGGTLFVVSYHPPEFIMPIIQNCPGMEWDHDGDNGIKHHAVPRVGVLEPPKADAGDSVQKEEADWPSLERGDNTPRQQCSPFPSAWSSGSFDPLSSAQYVSTVNVFLFRKVVHHHLNGRHSLLNRDEVRRHLLVSCDDWFRSRNPMVTPEREQDLRRLFSEALRQKQNVPADVSREGINNIAGNKLSASLPLARRDGEIIDDSLPLTGCYSVLFTDAEREHLTYENFLGDWREFLHTRESKLPADRMNIDVALAFLTEMQ